MSEGGSEALDPALARDIYLKLKPLISDAIRSAAQRLGPQNADPQRVEAVIAALDAPWKMNHLFPKRTWYGAKIKTPAAGLGTAMNVATMIGFLRGAGIDSDDAAAFLFFQVRTAAYPHLDPPEKSWRTPDADWLGAEVLGLASGLLATLRQQALMQ
jgi:hypothetical protein